MPVTHFDPLQLWPHQRPRSTVQFQPEGTGGRSRLLGICECQNQTTSLRQAIKGVECKLDALNFFLADVRDGLGPYLAIYLLTERKWAAAGIGAVMSLAGVAGILARTPAGSIFAPGIAALSLGIVGLSAFSRRVARPLASPCSRS